MFVKTVKLKKAPAVVCTVLAAAAVVLVAALCVVKAAGADKTYKVETEAQRQALISELGWEASEEPTEHKTVTIPEEFDDVYTAYNELQIQQGFDLSNFKGKEVEIYYYSVYNYKGHEDSVQLTLIGCDGVLIGGDVCCTELDGFMQGLLRTSDADSSEESLDSSEASQDESDEQESAAEESVEANENDSQESDSSESAEN